MNIGVRIAAVAVTALMLTSCGGNKPSAAPPPPAVHVVPAMPRTVRATTTLSGVIAPLQNVALTSDLTEPAIAVYVNEGDSVRAGQPLALLSTADLEADLVSAQRTAASADAHAAQMEYQASVAFSQGHDQLNSAEAALAQARENLTLAQSTLARDQQLVGQGFISAQTVEQQRTQVQVSQQGVVSAQDAVDQARENDIANGTPTRGLQQANIDQAKASAAASHAQAASIAAQIAKASIVSPIDGVVVNRNLNPGEYPGTRQIFTLQEVSRVYAELNAFGTQVAGIARGAPVRLTSPAVPARSFSGTVVALLSPTSPSSSGFIVKASVPNFDDALKPGMTVAASVTQPPESGIAVPVTSFIDDTHERIVTVDAGVAHVTSVTEVAEDQTYAIVRGLAAGVMVVANGQLGLADGQKVATR
ncbi:MAG TPA: efflux RND transporter periplasmic adaptor subunit [Candidatus Eremiobacteraceae bacterium]|nr:efflux RND transporter periplasmic adaptor subunit [Candidatus Eremiobacteraceae bacterium]